MDGELIMVPLTPEGMARESVRQDRSLDVDAETLRYYKLFLRGAHCEIARLRVLLAEMEAR